MKQRISIATTEYKDEEDIDINNGNIDGAS